MANNIMIVRHRLLTELIKLWKNEKLTTDLLFSVETAQKKIYFDAPDILVLIHPDCVHVVRHTTHRTTTSYHQMA